MRNYYLFSPTSQTETSDDSSVMRPPIDYVWEDVSAQVSDVLLITLHGFFFYHFSAYLTFFQYQYST